MQCLSNIYITPYQRIKAYSLFDCLLWKIQSELTPRANVSLTLLNEGIIPERGVLDQPLDGSRRAVVPFPGQQP